MSLVKKPKMTKKRLASLQEIRKHSHGPATPEGRNRIRAANLRHGFYSKDDEAAIRILGEDPADFQKLLEGLCGKETIVDTLQKRLAKRLARAFWRMDRADRMQDGYAVRQSKEEDYKREGRLHVQMMRLKMTSRSWQLLAQSVARPYYVTPPADLEMINNLHKEGLVKDMSQVAVGLFYELREPGMLKPGDPGFQDAETEAKTRHVMQKIRAIFGLAPLPEDGAEACDDIEGQQDAGTTEADVAPAFNPAHADLKVGVTRPEADQAEQQPDFPTVAGPESRVASPESGTPCPEPRVPCPDFRALYPNVTEEQWEAREPVRQLLENLLSRQVRIFDAQHHDLMRQCLAGPSPCERAAEIVPTNPNTDFMQRMENSNFRQVARMTSLLIRLRRQEFQIEDLRKSAASVHITENKAG